MPLFKPLLENGQIEEQPLVRRPEHSTVLHNAQVLPVDLPDFTDPNEQTAAEPEQANGEPSSYHLPDMDQQPEQLPEQMHVRKHADLKNKTFLPMLTIDPDEDPVEAARRQAEQIMHEATSQSEQMRDQAQTVLKDAHDSVAHIVEEAGQLNQQAQEALEIARQQAPAITEAAREEGFNSGYQDGMEQGMIAGQARLEALMADFTQAAKNLAAARDDVARALTPEIVALVEACLDKIFLIANSVDSGLVGQMVNQAISRLDEHSQITVRLNPGNLEHIPKLAPAMWAKMQAMHNITWVPDPDLRPGDCLIDTPITQIDATVQTRRQRIFAQLEDALQQGASLNLETILADAAEKRAHAEKASLVQPPPTPQPETEKAAAPLSTEKVVPDNMEDDSWADEAQNIDDDW